MCRSYFLYVDNFSLRKVYHSILISMIRTISRINLSALVFIMGIVSSIFFWNNAYAAGGSATINLGSTVTVGWTGNELDTCNRTSSPTLSDWDAASSDPSGSVAITPTSGGIYTLSINCTNIEGASITPTNLTLTVIDQAPTVTLTPNDPNPYPAVTSVPIQFTSTANDINSNLVQHHIDYAIPNSASCPSGITPVTVGAEKWCYNVSGQASFSPQGIHVITYNFTPVVPGTYTLRASACDNQVDCSGHWTSSSDVTVNVDLPALCGNTAAQTVAPSSNLCDAATGAAASSVVDTGNGWDWSCTSQHGASTASCHADSLTINGKVTSNSSSVCVSGTTDKYLCESVYNTDGSVTLLGSVNGSLAGAGTLADPYTWTCFGAGPGHTDDTSGTATRCSAGPTITLNAYPVNVPKGAKATISWEITNPNAACQILAEPVDVANLLSHAENSSVSLEGYTRDIARLNDTFDVLTTANSATSLVKAKANGKSSGTVNPKLNYTTNFSLSCDPDRASNTTKRVKINTVKPNEI